jgi:hypothetical protein
VKATIRRIRWISWREFESKQVYRGYGRHMGVAVGAGHYCGAGLKRVEGLGRGHT